MKTQKHFARWLTGLVAVVAFVVSGLGAGSAVATLPGCTKPQAQTALDLGKFTFEQVVCLAAEAELGTTNPQVAALACGPGLDAVLTDVEKFLLAQQKGKALAARRAAAASDAGVP